MPQASATFSFGFGAFGLCSWDSAAQHVPLGLFLINGPNNNTERMELRSQEMLSDLLRVEFYEFAIVLNQFSDTLLETPRL